MKCGQFKYVYETVGINAPWPKVPTVNIATSEHRTWMVVINQRQPNHRICNRSPLVPIFPLTYLRKVWKSPAWWMLRHECRWIGIAAQCHSRSTPRYKQTRSTSKNTICVRCRREARHTRVTGRWRRTCPHYLLSIFLVSSKHDKQMKHDPKGFKVSAAQNEVGGCQPNSPRGGRSLWRTLRIGWNLWISVQTRS